MNSLFNIEQFISNEITGRSESIVNADLNKYQTEIAENIYNKSVLVIGGAGTIGSSFIKALLPYSPAKLVVVDINENGLTELVRDCRSRIDVFLPEDFKSYPVNFGEEVFEKIFIKNGPFDVVANFAAHKHVRSEKDIYSIEAMLNNNVLKAIHLLDLLVKYPPKHFFCVSTDKAANPVNIMGASKKMMEEALLVYSKKIKITTARFANVAFSNGSLLAGFIERLIKRQPLSCPSDVTRYFVSPQEAGQLCLIACILGETGDIIFPKMNANSHLVSFANITYSFLKYFGFEVDECASEREAKEKALQLTSMKYPVYFFKSETSGEKLYEEFYTEDEVVELNKFSALGVIKNSTSRTKEELTHILDTIENIFLQNSEKADVVSLLNILIPNFQHMETGINLDQKM